MDSQTGSRMSTYGETIDGLKKELQSHIDKIKSSTDWPDFERLYRALCTVEEIAGVPKTSLDELLGLTPANTPETSPQNAAAKSSLPFGDQVETKPATEIEKGS